MGQLRISANSTFNLAAQDLYVTSSFFLTSFSGNGTNFLWTGGTIYDSLTRRPLTMTHGAIDGIPIPAGASFVTTVENILQVPGNSGQWETYTQASGTAITMTCTVDGTYNQTGGTHIIKDALQISSNLYAVGVYNLSGGLLDASLAVGTNGSEILDFAGGQSAIGTLNQSGGINLSGKLVVGGLAGAGVYYQTGGINRPQSLRLGVVASSGFYGLTGPSVLDVAGDEFVGYDPPVNYANKSAFYQAGGTHRVGGNLYVRDGTFQMTDGTLSVIGTEVMSSSFGVGALTQSGGSNTASGGLVIPGGFDYVYGGGPITLSSYHLQGGTLVTPLTTNHGSFIQPGGFASLGVLSGTGITNLGGGTSFAQLNVQSFSQGTLTIGSNSLLTVAPAAARVTNSATSLAVFGSGQLDLANHDLLLDRTATPYAAVQGWVRSGYNGGAWTGPGIISSTAASNPAHFGIAVIDGANPGGVPNVASNRLLVRAHALYGDTRLRGTVDLYDYQTLVQNFHSTNTVTWAQADFNSDKRVDLIDYLALARNVPGRCPRPRSISL